MIEFDTVLTDREKLIILVLDSVCANKRKFYRSITTKAKLANLDLGINNVAIENTVTLVRNFHDEYIIKGF